MSDNERERDRVEEQEPVREENRKEFENALPGLSNGAPPIEAPSA